jgi:triphosphoribosyl-dephospho-CoA synthetase
MNVTEHSQKSSKMGLLKVDVDGMSYFSLILSLFFSNQYHPWLENTEGAIISKTDILEILATLGTQNEDKQNKNTTQYVLDTTICKQTQKT